MQKKFLQPLYLLIFVLLIIEAIVCNDYRNIQNEQKLADREMLKLDIEYAINQLKKNNLPYIDLSKVARFSWDKFYVFGPYTSERSIKSVLGILSPWGIGTTVDSSENKVFLVFTRQGNVVHSLDYYTSGGDFSFLIDRNTQVDDTVPHAEYSYEQARFALDESGRIIWVGNQ